MRLLNFLSGLAVVRPFTMSATCGEQWGHEKKVMFWYLFIS